MPRRRGKKGDGSRLMVLQVVPGLRGGVRCKITQGAITFRINLGYERKLRRAMAREGCDQPLVFLKGVILETIGKGGGA